jgi:hypothetical protein
MLRSKIVIPCFVFWVILIVPSSGGISPKGQKFAASGIKDDESYAAGKKAPLMTATVTTTTTATTTKDPFDFGTSG